MMRIAAGDDGQAERARLDEQHHFRPEILAVDLERVQATQIVDTKLSELLLGTEHVRADPRDVEVCTDVEELAQGRLVAVRQDFGEGAVEPAKLGDVAQDDDVRALADVDLGARNQRDVAGPEHAALGGIRALEMLVNRPEVGRVEMLGEREAVESHPAGHTYHALHGPRVELEMLRHLRVRVGIDPLQTVRLLSEFIHSNPQCKTTTNSKRTGRAREHGLTLHNILLLGYYRTANSVLLGTDVGFPCG